jgi:hypothetical protein
VQWRQRIQRTERLVRRTKEVLDPDGAEIEKIVHKFHLFRRMRIFRRHVEVRKSGGEGERPRRHADAASRFPLSCCALLSGASPSALKHVGSGTRLSSIPYILSTQAVASSRVYSARNRNHRSVPVVLLVLLDVFYRFGDVNLNQSMISERLL